MPWMSSGVVSPRTRMTGFFLAPWPALITASSAVKTICPTAAPGDAGSPVARTDMEASLGHLMAAAPVADLLQEV
jgi:hypothetical protein